MKALLSAAVAAAALFSASAFAAAFSIAPVQIDPKFQEKLAEEYGVREGETLSKEVIQQLERAMTRAGHTRAEAAPVQIEVTIVDAIPNKPTFKKLADNPGLDYHRSFGVGGAELKARILDAQGGLLREVSYRWFENDIQWAYTAGTWTDANRAIRAFANDAVEAAAAAPERPAGS